MKYDHNLLTGLFLGITIGLWYMDNLAAYLPLFVLASIVFIMRYVAGSK